MHEGRHPGGSNAKRGMCYDYDFDSVPRWEEVRRIQAVHKVRRVGSG